MWRPLWSTLVADKMGTRVATEAAMWQRPNDGRKGVGEACCASIRSFAVLNIDDIALIHRFNASMTARLYGNSALSVILQSYS